MMQFAASRQAGLRRRWWPLTVSLAVHALLVGLWVRHADLRPVPPDAPEPLSVLVLAAPLPQRRPPEPPAASTKPDEKTVKRHAPVALPAPVATAPEPPPVAAATVVAPDPAPVAARPSAADILAEARRDIGKFDREARGGKLGAALRPRESAWDRFGQRVADAHIERGPAPVTESYTSPDGGTYYRTRVGDRYYCRKTGTLDPSSTWKTGAEMHANSMSTLGMGGTAGLVLCPGSERDWKRE
ncbi:MAG: hypothetical protein ACXWC4_01755 [Telluria sp.]